MRKTGFTLIELLMVVLILGILFGLTSMGVLKVMKDRLIDQAKAEKQMLESAIRAYHHEYTIWPGMAPAQTTGTNISIPAATLLSALKPTCSGT